MVLTRILSLALCLLASAPLAFGAGSARKPQELYGTYKGRIVLKPTEKPHRLKGLMTIGPRAMLVVEAGSVLYFDPQGPQAGGGVIKVLGGLQIKGTSSKPVVFLADVPARIVIGNLAIKDDRRTAGRAGVGVSITGAVLHNVTIMVHGGVNKFKDVHFERGRVTLAGKTPSALVVSAGAAKITNCTFTGSGAGVGLHVDRADTYPQTTIAQCVFRSNGTGLEVEQATLYDRRVRVTVSGCNFIDNKTAIHYQDEAVPLRAKSCYFEGAKTTREAKKRITYGDGRGRVILQSVARRASSRSGHGIKTKVDIAAILKTVEGRPASAAKADSGTKAAGNGLFTESSKPKEPDPASKKKPLDEDAEFEDE